MTVGLGGFVDLGKTFFTQTDFHPQQLEKELSKKPSKIPLPEEAQYKAVSQARAQQAKLDGAV